MNFPELWQQLCRKKPLLNNKTATVEITSENLESLLRQAYEQGQKNTEKANSLFGRIFGS